MKMVAWLQRDSYKSLSNRLRALKLDYGKGFTTELLQGPDKSVLKISSCFYKTIFEVEDVPQLTAACCCSQDRVWLEGAPRKGVNAGLESSMAQGHPCCRFVVEKIQK
jgi:L-2-amino-thiazoline-4-carboxylic acid hydrolase